MAVRNFSFIPSYPVALTELVKKGRGVLELPDLILLDHPSTATKSFTHNYPAMNIFLDILRLVRLGS